VQPKLTPAVIQFSYLLQAAGGVRLARLDKLARAVSEAWAAATSEDGISHI